MDDVLRHKLNRFGCSSVIEYIEQLELDAKRWNAFINSPTRIIGWAGLDSKDPNKPDEKDGRSGYAHFGCEMWTKHSGWAGDSRAQQFKNLLIGFADQAIRCGNHERKSN